MAGDFDAARYHELKEKLKADKKGVSKEEKTEFKRLKEIKEAAKEEKVLKLAAKFDEVRASEKARKAQDANESPEESEPQSDEGTGQGSESIQKARKKKEKEPKKPKEVKITEEMIEPENRWWIYLDDNAAEILTKETIKWNSLEHHGIMFPAMYKAHGVPLLYGKPGSQERYVLPPDVEELATFWCGQIGLESETKGIFISNFWNEFQKVLKDSGNQKLMRIIQDFKLCNFTLIHQHLQEAKEKKKLMTKEDKELEKQIRDKAEESFRYCLMDGYREKVGTIKVEPPTLFKGRGEHPKQGKLKDRIMPESCVMNCDNCLPPPICTVPGRAWQNVVHDDSVNWLGYYKQESDDKESTKYIQMDKTSEIKTKPDLMKYERARRLCQIVQEIRRDYQWKLKNGESLVKKQIGTCAYFIDRLALRVGNEKNTDEEADTVGCTSLRVEHVRLDFESFKADKPMITLDFLGKDSIRYLNNFPVPPSVFKNLALFMKGKKMENQLFEKVSPPDLNDYFQEFMPDLTAKVFRTYNASFTLEQQLSQYDAAKIGTGQEALLAFYNEANKKVAILCNHQKAVSKNHEIGVQKLQEKGADLRGKLKVLQNHLKLQKQGGRLEPVASDPHTHKLPQKQEMTEKAILTLADRIRKHAVEVQLKEGNKNVSLTTSKINYMDPRITIAFCKRTGLDVGKVLTKTIQQKFPWAMDVAENYKFFKQPQPLEKRAGDGGDLPDAKRQRSE